jgi:predicted  nucleic acid-binding Zn-ribbon protein
VKESPAVVKRFLFAICGFFVLKELEMKKILLLMFLPLLLAAQPYQSVLNSTSTPLDSAATYTGTTEEISADYTWIVVTVRSNQSGTGIIQWTKSKMGTVIWDNAGSFTYTANDTTNNRFWFPITMGYFRIKYTNGATDQTTFRLTSTLFKGNNLPLESNKTQVTDTSSQASLDFIEADADSTVDMVTSINTDTDSLVVLTTDIETDVDSLLNLNTQMNTSLNNIEADADSTVDIVTDIETSLDSSIVLQNTTNAKLDSIEVSVNATNLALVEVNNGIDSLDASNTRIEGYLDNVEAKQDSAEVTLNIIAAKDSTSLSRKLVTVTNDSTSLSRKFVTITNDSTSLSRKLITITNDSTSLSRKSIQSTVMNDSLTVKDVLGIKQNQINRTQKTQLTNGTTDVMVENGASYDALYVRLTDGSNVSSLSGTGDLEVSGDGGAVLATAQRQDTTNARIEEIKLDIETIKQNQTNGNQLVKPYLSYVRSIDTWGAASDTSVYDFANNYLRGYVSVYDTSATADTLVFESYSYTKGSYTSQMVGFKDVVTNVLEADNSTVIISGTVAKKYLINIDRPGLIRVRPKTLTARSTIKTKRVVFEGIN